MCNVIQMKAFKNGRMNADASPNETPEQVSARRVHPMFQRWQMLRRREGTLAPVWADDFWRFAADIGERPEDGARLRRGDKTKPYGPDNWGWAPVWNAEVARKYHSKRRADDPDMHREYHFRRQYGITVSDYDAMLRAQNDQCAICGAKESRFWKKGVSPVPRLLAVDHDHVTGAVRGLLCGDCNVGMGAFRDDPFLVMRAAQYLFSHKMPRPAPLSDGEEKEILEASG